MVFFHSVILFLTLIAATSGYIAVREDRAVSTSSDEEDSGSGVGHQGELVSLTGEPAAHPPPEGRVKKGLKPQRRLSKHFQCKCNENGGFYETQARCDQNCHEKSDAVYRDGGSHYIWTCEKGTCTETFCKSDMFKDQPDNHAWCGRDKGLEEFSEGSEPVVYRRPPT